MSQYWMHRKDDSKNLHHCIDNYECIEVFIRRVGSYGGEVKLTKKMNRNKLEVKYEKGLIKVIIDGNLGFSCIDADDSFKGFSIEYRNEHGMPYWDMKHPSDDQEVYQSVLRNIWDNHLVEISFKGKIPLEEDGEFYKNWTKWRIRK